MRDRPSGAELLAAAHKLLREELLAALPADRKHDALMVANALSIAARQLEYGEAPERRELQALAALLENPEAGEPSDPTELRAALLLANQHLARRIRHGAGDPGRPQRDAILAHLRGTTRQRVLESNPKYLKG